MKKIKWKKVPKNINGYLGFVYRIEEISTGKYYIGQKKFWFKDTKYLAKQPTKTETKRLETYEKKDHNKYEAYKLSLKKKYKGKKTKIKSLYESDWKEYNSSSKQLIKDIENKGEDAFTFEIIHLCINQAELNYLELKEQVLQNVLLSDKSYNGLIRVFISKNGLKRLKVD